MKSLTVFWGLCLLLSLLSCNDQKISVLQKQNIQLQTKINELQQKIDEFELEKKLEAKNLALFDEMDFVAFTKHDMPHIDRLHDENVRVVNPDLTETHALKPHSDGMAYLFKLFPDMVIDEHPVKFASGDWTAGLGIAKMTFTKPYVLPDGSKIMPNNKKYKRGMITLAKWKEGKIVEEYIFYDNMSFINKLRSGKP